MIRDGWYCCPHCGQKLFRVTEKAICEGVQMKCKKCKIIIDVKIKLSH